MDTRSTTQPSVIFLDAVGTLFGVRGSVGQVYATIAQRHGVRVTASAIDRAFIASFKAAPAFVAENSVKLQAQEYIWWQAIATETFRQAGALPQFRDFASFFAELYDHFATATPWFVYPDVIPALERWQGQKIPLGVLSNFDTRLYAVLAALDLERCFTSVTLSTEAGAAKPDSRIFHTALQKHGCTPDRAWHIGDSYTEDYQGATAAGLRGIWLDRKG